MTLVQRSRFSNWLKNLTGFKGPFGLSLDGGISPVYDFSTRQPEIDDETAYWYVSSSQAASVGNFSSAQLVLAALTSPNVRAIVDGIYIRNQAAVSTVNVGITAVAAGTALNSLLLGNNFLSVRTGQPFSVGLISLGALQLATRQTAASFFAGLFFQVDVGAGLGSQPAVLAPLPPFVITPNFALSLEPTVVNTGLAFGAFGRLVGDQL